MAGNRPAHRMNLLLPLACVVVGFGVPFLILIALANL